MQKILNWLPVISGGILLLTIVLILSAPMVGGTFGVYLRQLLFKAQIALANPIAFYRDNANYLIALVGLNIVVASVAALSGRKAFRDSTRHVIWIAPLLGMLDLIAVVWLLG